MKVDTRIYLTEAKKRITWDRSPKGKCVFHIDDYSTSETYEDRGTHYLMFKGRFYVFDNCTSFNDGGKKHRIQLPLKSCLLKLHKHLTERYQDNIPSPLYLFIHKKSCKDYEIQDFGNELEDTLSFIQDELMLVAVS